MAVLQGGTDTSVIGQNVAEETGNAYSDIAKVPDTVETTDIPTYDAEAVSGVLANKASISNGLDTVDADKSTVAGQLNSLLASDSSYIKQAEDAGKEYGASRGMLNSAASAGYARKEAIAAAVPIASADAATYAAAQGRSQAATLAQNQTQTEGIVSSEMTAQKAAIAQNTQNVQNAFNAAMQGASEANSVILQDMQNQYNTFNTEMTNTQNAMLQQESISAEKAETIRTQSSAIMQNYQISVENLMTDPDFLNLGSTAMNKAINTMQTLAKNSISFLGASSSVDLTPFVNAYLTNLTVV